MISLVERPKGRRAAIGMMYEKTDISEQISRDIESFSYSDVAASKSDSVSITIRASEDKWKGEWMPDKGAKLYPSIIVYDWNIGGVVNGVRPYSAECGAFMVEETSFSASPDKLSISGVAKPNDTSFSARRRTFTWKETSIKNIAKKIGERYGLQVKFDAEDQQVDAKEQDATDSAFLQDLCETYALVIKVYAQQLWIYDREKYKQKSAVWTAYKEMPKNNRTAICVESGSFSWSTSTTGTYTGGIYTYTNKKKGINISVTVGTEERQLKLTGKVSSEADAKARLKAAIRNANHGSTSCSFTIIGYPVAASAQCINISGFGSKIDGKYFVNELNHTYSVGSGYKTKVKASKVEDIRL